MKSMSEQEFKNLVTYIKDNYGINLSRKKVLVEGRLNNMIAERGFNSFSQYIDELFNDKSGSEMTNLINKITTNHTFFMRESIHFEFFKKVVLPYIQESSKDRDMRIWSAGCSSGEEPYTLEMIIKDYLGEKAGLWNTQILATDISKRVLNIAENGIYSEDSIANIPPVWKLNYFMKINNENYKVCDEIRNKIIFRIFNLMEDEFPFKRKFQVIFCRNVMIYFDDKTKIKLINKFYDMTEPGGYLFIGHSENINKQETAYNYVMPSVYRKG